MLSREMALIKELERAEEAFKHSVNEQVTTSIAKGSSSSSSTAVPNSGLLLDQTIFNNASLLELSDQEGLDFNDGTT